MSATPCKCGAECSDRGADDVECDGDTVVQDEGTEKERHRCMAHAQKYGLQISLRIAPEAMDLFAPSPKELAPSLRDFKRRLEGKKG